MLRHNDVFASLNIAVILLVECIKSIFLMAYKVKFVSVHPFRNGDAAPLRACEDCNVRMSIYFGIGHRSMSAVWNAKRLFDTSEQRMLGMRDFLRINTGKLHKILFIATDAEEMI